MPRPKWNQYIVSGSYDVGDRRRAVFYCPACNAGFEVAMTRCPICRARPARPGSLKPVRRYRASDKQRRKISKNRRHLVYMRDGYRCLRCGSTKRLTLDHVVPISAGGSNEEYNLQTLCQGCNCTIKKGKSTDYRKRVG